MNKNKQKKVIVALSGGVDSSLSAYILKKQGFIVEGVYLQVWSDKDISECPWHEDIEIASNAAKKIGIPFRSLHIEKEYKKKVVEYMIQGYKSGITPNPDIMCNHKIKFGIFLNWAIKQGADFAATGHYARREIKNNIYRLLKGVDKNKDQSYFLYRLNQSRLKRILFPIGNLTKSKVRKIAKSAGLPNWDRKDSQGICFVGKIQLKKFLKNYIKPKIGYVIDEYGNKIGEHQGVFYYTIGQRHGLDIGSSTGSSPYYISEKRIKDNIIIVAKGRNNPRLYSKELICSNINWIIGLKNIKKEFRKINNKLTLKCKAKIRYRQEDQECIITLQEDRFSNNALYLVKFKKPQFAVAPGQSIVFYNKYECLGGGIMIKNKTIN